MITVLLFMVGILAIVDLVLILCLMHALDEHIQHHPELVRDGIVGAIEDQEKILRKCDQGERT